MTSYVEEQVAARIAAARRKVEEQQRRRRELAQAREAGLAARKRAKLRRLADTFTNESLSASGA